MCSIDFSQGHNNNSREERAFSSDKAIKHHGPKKKRKKNLKLSLMFYAKINLKWN